MKNKLIKFGIDPQLHGIAKIPAPAKQYVPQWYKDTPTHDSEDKRAGTNTFKSCMPFLDSLTSGYIFELWTDIEVKNINGQTEIKWARHDYDLIENRNKVKSLEKIPSRPHHHSLTFALKSPLAIKTPPGYSVLISSPFNRLDLPIKPLVGVVDTDKNPMHSGLIPFEMALDFEGIVKKGTPLIQILPFKRENWTSEEDVKVFYESEISGRNINSYFTGGYKLHSWFKKDYN